MFTQIKWRFVYYYTYTSLFFSLILFIRYQEVEMDVEFRIKWGMMLIRVTCGCHVCGNIIFRSILWIENSHYKLTITTTTQSVYVLHITYINTMHNRKVDFIIVTPYQNLLAWNLSLFVFTIRTDFT